MGSRFFKIPRFVFYLFSLIIVLSFSTVAPNPYQDLTNSDFGSSTFNDFKIKENTDWQFSGDRIRWGTQEDDYNQAAAAMATKVIAAVIIFLVLVSFIAFLICLCCPICILAKMRNRRRGVIYHPAGVGNTTTVQTGNTRTTVTVLQAPRSTVTPSATNLVVANNAPPANSPYPVQQSVTVMPVPNSNGQINYGHNPYPMPNQSTPYPVGPNGMPVPMTHNAPGAGELPPPYPGLPREVDNLVQSGSSQPAYNPYFTGDGSGNPNPYMPTTAPYPTKH